MELYLSERFLHSFGDLPKPIRKKVMEFISKFRNDSTSKSIHLEPIITFKDPQLRTARVDLKYRAILHVSSTGETYHLLWVDNHDEAMNWAENKVFEWNKSIQTYQLYETQPVQLPVNAKESAISSTAFCGMFSNNQLLSIGIPYPLIPSVKSINNFDDLEGLEPYLPIQAFESIYSLLDGISIEEIIKEIEEGKVKSDSFEEQLTSANNLRGFFKVEDDGDIEELLNGDLSKWKVFLHPTQRKIAEERFKGSFKVSGAAGTGKTVLALHRLKNLCKNSKQSRSILFTTFTKSLVDNLKGAIAGLGIESEKVLTVNIHSYILDKAKAEGLIPHDAKIIDFLQKETKEMLWREFVAKGVHGYDAEFLKKEYEGVILFNNVRTIDDYLKVQRTGLETSLGSNERKKVWELITAFIKSKEISNAYYLDEIANLLTNKYEIESVKPFNHIIADEMQDFSNVELRLLRALVPKKEDDLFFVGDPLQKIYKKRINFSKAGINIRGHRSKRLRVNYRTTEEIKRRAVEVITNQVYDDFDGNEESRSGYVSVLHGELPSYKLFKSAEDMNAHLLKIIEEAEAIDKINRSEICIAGRTKKSLTEARKCLHANHIDYFDLTEMLGVKSGIVLSTFHNIKGLEYKVVILYDVSTDTVPNKYNSFETLKEKDKKSFELSERSLLYVAMTRAIKRLYIMGVGTQCEWLKGAEG